jgi:dihydropteroate synthase
VVDGASTSASAENTAQIPSLMGIVNVTPDSFSDGGQFGETDAAVQHALMLAADGAQILDIGGESTRPNAEPVEEAEELRRVLPVIERLVKQTSVPISIDTSKSRVAREALSLGATIINDVSGLEGDPEMLDVALEFRATVCVMHMRGNPRTMQIQPVYGNVVYEILEYLRNRRDALLDGGIPREKIILDPGIGFGKSKEHNLRLLQAIEAFHSLECKLLVGHSRKRFLANDTSDSLDDRIAATIGVSVWLAQAGVQILRVHDVRKVRRALQAFQAAGGQFRH